MPFARKDVDIFRVDSVNKPVFVVNSARPAIAVFQVFRFSNTLGGAISVNIFKQRENSIDELAVVVVQ